MDEHDETSFESFQFIDEEIDNSFTALLDLPPNQAVKLLHSPDVFRYEFPVTEIENSPEMMMMMMITADLPDSNVDNCNPVKREPIESGYLRSNSSPVFSDLIKSKSNLMKRNDPEKQIQVRSSVKKKKKAANETEGEKAEYIRVRARRGEATDSHSLAERARREKINTRMKLLQELVPGCNKISGTAMVLDKIINHVQSLQHQVEFLSMKLAAVQPDTDINLDNLFTSESGSPVESTFAGMISPSWWVDGQDNGNTKQTW